MRCSQDHCVDNGKYFAMFRFQNWQASILYFYDSNQIEIFYPLITVSDRSCGIQGATYDALENSCKCGNVVNCAASAYTAPYCDAPNNKCKCSETVDACGYDRESCTQGLCKCGTGEPCDPTSPYCDLVTNKCLGKNSRIFCQFTYNINIHFCYN